MGYREPTVPGPIFHSKRRRKKDCPGDEVVYGYESLGYSLKGANISMDRYYMPIPLAEWLLNKGITMIGTMNNNRKGIPPGMKESTTAG